MWWPRHEGEAEIVDNGDGGECDVCGFTSNAQKIKDRRTVVWRHVTQSMHERTPSHLMPRPELLWDFEGTGMS